MERYLKNFNGKYKKKLRMMEVDKEHQRKSFLKHTILLYCIISKVQFELYCLILHAPLEHQLPFGKLYFDLVGLHDSL